MRRLASLAAMVVAAVVVAALLTGSSRGAAGPYQVRAIFDDAAFAVPGEDVRIAGAPVGSIKSLDVTPAKKAAVTFEIDDSRFTPFYANATCAIRPQSLIGERYVDCNPGTLPFPELPRIDRGDGAGTYLLPVTRTHSPVDSDIVQNISRQPIQQRFALIIDELGTGLAARGSDLNNVIHRANPALGYTDRVIRILAAQNRALARLAVDSDAVLTPLAKIRRAISDFIVQANTTAVASAARSAEISRSIQLFPGFLRALRPLMVQLGRLADQGTPLMAELGQSAAALGRQFQNLKPFALAARPALIDLGAAAQQSQPALITTTSLAQQLKSLGSQLEPTALLLNSLTGSLDRTGAIEQLMALLFNGTSATNGFDRISHYVRDQLSVGDCTGYAQNSVPGCSANLTASASAARSNAVASAARVGPARTVSRRQSAAVATAAAARRSTGGAPVQALNGLLRYLIGGQQ